MHTSNQIIQSKILQRIIVRTFDDKSTFYEQLSELNNIQDPDKVIELNMSNRNLKVVPSEVYLFSNIRIIWLENNEISELPADLFNITSLVKLNVWNNPIKEIPKNIRKLINLEYLGLRYCPIKALPIEIMNCRKLQKIQLFGCPLNFVPVPVYTFIDKIKNPQNYDQHRQYYAVSDDVLSIEELHKIIDFCAQINISELYEIDPNYTLHEISQHNETTISCKKCITKFSMHDILHPYVNVSYSAVLFPMYKKSISSNKTTQFIQKLNCLYTEKYNLDTHLSIQLSDLCNILLERLENQNYCIK